MLEEETTPEFAITWRDLSVSVKIRSRSFFRKNPLPYKRLIKNVSGVIKSGSLVVLMGPSGAGKSTLMGALAHRNASDVFVEGAVRVNGAPVSRFAHQTSGFMHQEDLFVGTLTVREHLQFMARLKLGGIRTRNEVNTIVESVIAEMGLLNCANTRIGRPGEATVISGGERKRLAFATEVLTDPPILFCDEPTTGLDSFSAQYLVTLMKQMSSRGKTVLCTVHQPSSELFSMFQKLIFLADGRIAFMGGIETALKFFQENGVSCPTNYNPAEIIIEALSVSAGKNMGKVKRLCDQFSVSEDARKIDEILAMMEDSQECLRGRTKLRKQRLVYCSFVHIMLKEFVSAEGFSAFSEFCCLCGSCACGSRTRLILVCYSPDWMTKTYLLTYRSFLQVLRDPSVQVVRILQKLGIALMAGLCFFGSINLTQAGVRSVQGAIFILVTENTFPPMYGALSLFPEEFPLFLREYKNDLYSPHLYYISKMISYLPGLIIEAVLFVLVAYLISGLKRTFYAFSMSTAIAILTTNVASACGFFFSSAFGSVSMALAFLVPIDYTLMVTSGLFIKLSSIPSLMSWFRYLSWFMYSNEALSIVQWENVNNITCEYANSEIPCLENGEEVLGKFDFSTSHLNENILAMGVLYCIFHVLAYVCFRWKTSRNS